MNWFRFYHEVLDDPKVQKLSPDLFKTWINILCLASKCDGKLPVTCDISFSLRLSQLETESAINSLKEAGLLEEKRGHLMPYNWDKRQYKSDTSAERTKQYRDRKKIPSLPVTRDVTTTVTVTPPDTEQSRAETEQNRTEIDRPKKKSVRGMRLMDHPLMDPKENPTECCPDDWGEWAILEHKLSVGELIEIWEEFRNYWKGKAGKDAVKVDWFATWQNGVIRAIRWRRGK